MDIQRISCKIYAEDQSAIGDRVEQFIPVFHRWIQSGELSGLPIDVADYGHVPGGPGVMLIGHEADRAIDLGEGRPGFLYARKRDATGSLADRVAQVVGETVAGAARLEAEGLLGFRRDELRIQIADRLNAPNSDATLDALAGEISKGMRAVSSTGPVELEREGDERRPFAVRVGGLQVGA